MRQLLTFLYLLLYIVTLQAQGDSVVRLTHFSEAEGYEQSVVSYAIQDSRGFVWLATWNGLVQYDGYRFKTYKMRPGDSSPLRTNRIGTVRERPDGDLECTTADSMTLVFHLRTETFEQISADYSQRPRPYSVSPAIAQRIEGLPQLSDDNARILLTDRQGGIWVDTHSGLYRVWQIRRPLEASNRGRQEVRAIYADRQGRKWVADKNGIVRIDEDYLSPQGQLSSQPVAFGLKVYCIFEDSRGDMWLGCKPGGLVRLRSAEGGRAFTMKRYQHDGNNPYSLSCDNVYAICEDNQQRLWIATYGGGLNMLNLSHDNDQFHNSGNDLAGWPRDEASNKMHCLHITPGQTLVAGTLNGLYSCQLSDTPAQLHFYHNCRRADDDTSLSYDWVTDLQPLGSDTLAIATSGGGLCMADTRQLLSDNTAFRTFTTRDGLASDVCQSLLYDSLSQTLFIVSWASISSMQLPYHTITNTLRGTLGQDFNLLETKPLRTALGHYLFGTTQGVLDIAPGDFSKSNYRPDIVFYCPDTLSLSPGERSLTIRFAAIDFNKSMPITYAYRIEGMNDEWTYITDSQLTLPDIPAGTFLLHLRSTNGDGVWTDNERVLFIHRRAAFHETPYAWMLYGLLLTLLIIAIIQTVRYVRRMQKELKDIKLTSQQRISVMGAQLQELLSIRQTVEPVDVEAETIEDEEDRLFADRLKSYVAQNLSNAGLSVPDMARDMAVSRTVLFARMKSVFGTSPGNYLLNQRIEHACQLLRQPNIYVADVAYRCGFSDPKYFSRCFKKLVGQTPTDYQKEKRESRERR
ncbi:MAG: helix-turn-helix domain-containing protein [Prevotella sp.]|nr:helix-turn-helix domain-containing protein [Prevotella sp.]